MARLGVTVRLSACRTLAGEVRGVGHLDVEGERARRRRGSGQRAAAEGDAAGQAGLAAGGGGRPAVGSRAAGRGEGLAVTRADAAAWQGGRARDGQCRRDGQALGLGTLAGEVAESVTLMLKVNVPDAVGFPDKE